jgi:holo-[acyl-carrier protein] synthase
MEIIGIGTDIIECVRIRRMIERHGELFLARVFTEQEILYCRARKRSTEHFAGRWAAKEAVLKSLGTGMTHGLCWNEIEVCNDTSGQPQIELCGGTRELAEKLRATEILISISHCRSYATAYATALRDEAEDE